MAKLNKDRILRMAEKYISSGKPDAALKEYEKWIVGHPNDWNTILKAADLYARIGKNDKAIPKYMEMARHFHEEGFNVRAIAMYRKVLKLDPRNEIAMESVAELQKVQGLLVESKAQYQALVELLSRSGQKNRAAEVFGKLATLDPTDLKVRYKFAELLTHQGKIPEAIAEYAAIADECIKQGHVPEAIKVMEKGLSAEPSNRVLRCKLAQASVVQGDTAKAIRLLSEIQGKYPDDTELWTRLGEAYMAGGHLDQAEKVFGRLVELEPDNPDHSSRMADLAIDREDYDRGLSLLSFKVDEVFAKGEGERAVELLRKILRKEPHHVKTLVKLAELYTVLKNEQGRLTAYDRLCEAYTRHGNIEKAIDVAGCLLELDPENTQHEDRLRFLKSRLGEPSDDADIHIPDTEPEPVVIASLPASADEDAVPKLSPEEEEHIKESLTEAEVFVKFGLIEKGIEQLQNVLQTFPFQTSVREKLIEVYREEGMVLEACRELEELSAVYRRAGDDDKARALLREAKTLDSSPEPMDEIVVVDEGAEEEELEKEVVDVVPIESADYSSKIELIPEPEIDDDEVFPTVDDEDEELAIEIPSVTAGGSTPALHEVDEYVALGLYEDALVSLRELLQRNPEDPELLARIEELESSAAQLQEHSPPPTESPDKGSFSESQRDVGGSSRRVGSDESLSDPGLEAVFREFKIGVEKQLGEGDFETRYNLGIAYKEMGLIDEAIAEFQIVAKDPTRFLDCCSMLGVCFMEKGMAKLAIKWFEKGLASPDRNDAESHGLLYDLALAYETVGDTDRALELYMEIYVEDTRFRDVSDRVRQLKGH